MTLNSDLRHVFQSDEDGYVQSRFQYVVTGVCFVVFEASPPKFINVRDVMQLANGVTDMALAHEIAIGSEFRLEQIEANPER